MKKRSLISIALLLAVVLFAQDSLAEDYTRWNLPEGALARLGKGAISEVAYSPDGTRLAVAGNIGTWLYDAATGAEVALLTGHTNYVRSVSFSPDGTTLASGGSDGTVRLWDMTPYLAPAAPTGIHTPATGRRRRRLWPTTQPLQRRTQIATRLAAPRGRPHLTTPCAPVHPWWIGQASGPYQGS